MMVYSEFNISTYILVVQSRLIEHRGKEEAGRFLIEPITAREEVTFDPSSKKISELVTRVKDVQECIQAVLSKAEVISAVQQHFSEKVIKDMNVHAIDDVCNELIQAMDIDNSVPDIKFKELKQKYDDGDTSDFLAFSLLYALSRPNAWEEGPAKADDFAFLLEMKNCPLCRKPLVKTIKSKSRRKYQITRIYPENLDSGLAAEFELVKNKPRNLDQEDNLIALCKDCSEDYEANPELQVYRKLIKTKNRAKKNQEMIDASQNFYLEEEICDVLTAISRINAKTRLKKLRTDALTVDNKISDEYFQLREYIRDNCIKYFYFVENELSQLERDGMTLFVAIGSDVASYYQSLKAKQYQQDEIFESVLEWILAESGLDNKYRLACGIVASFFVQNCEVFG